MLPETSQRLPATITQWKDHVDAFLPPKEKVRERNCKITSIYASLYHKYPTIFKWAGMASFASHKVGLALRAYDLIGTDNNPHNDLVMDDVNVLRTANNMIYDDLAWLHFAYISPGGGIDLIRKLLWDDRSNLLLLGFMNIHKGNMLLDIDKEAANKYIWEGNTQILKHEQQFTIQPMFEKLDFAFRKFLAIACAMDFDADHFSKHSPSYTSFYIYMLMYGKGVMLRTRSLPSIVNFDHRWTWIDKRMMAIWKRVEQNDPGLPARIDQLMNERIGLANPS